MEAKHNHRRHNVNLLMYHIVCVAKYRRSVFTDKVDETIRETCLEIEKRHEIGFIEI
jgi:REP element-mobilizing transposase RayT